MEKAADILQDRILPMLAERRKQAAEIAGNCPEHGEYTWGEAVDSYGRCPKCQKRREEEAKRAEAFRRFVEDSGVPKRFQDYKLTDFIPPTPEAEKIRAFVGQYAADFPAHAEAGRCIVMCGHTGTGKTMLGCAVARHVALEHGQRVRYTTAYHIVQSIKETYGSNANERDVVCGYVDPSLLIVDEIGVQFGTDTEKLLLFEVLNGRYEAVKPTIVISNLELAEIGKYLGDRVMDRLREAGGAVLVFDWQSHRTGQ